MTSPGSDQLLVFERDDAGYLGWLASHPAGFVINCAPRPSPDYVVLHRASCRSLEVVEGDGRRWTVAYIKVCAPSPGALTEWCRRQVGSDPQPCGLCHP